MEKSIQKASILGILGNFLLLIMKGLVGTITGSQSMLADAFNSASDVFSSVMTFIGNRISSKVADDDHNLGHGKAEYIFSMLISIAMFVLGYRVLIDSIKSLWLMNTYQFSFFLILVCFLTIFVKILLFLYTNSLYKKYNNILIRANSVDHLNDCFLTSLNLFACILGFFQIPYIDGIVGILITLYIFKAAKDIFKESYDVLMDKAIRDDLKDQVYAIIKKYPDIQKVTDFTSIPVGYQYQISFTIYIDGNMSTFDSHSIADNLEKTIKNEMKEIYLTVIHVNPWKE